MWHRHFSMPAKTFYFNTLCVWKPLDQAMSNLLAPLLIIGQSCWQGICGLSGTDTLR